MDYMLQTHGAKFVCNIPDGLKELMMDISREVLRSQPTETYCFIADFLDALLISRENVRIATRVVSSLADASATIADLLYRTGMTMDQADKAASIVQDAFREHTLRKRKGSPEKLKEYEILQEIIQKTRVTPDQALKAAVIIQSAFKSYRARQDEEDRQICPDVIGIDWMKAARNTMTLYERAKPTKEQIMNAAILIQAAYRGYYTRRNILAEKKYYEALEREEQQQRERMDFLHSSKSIMATCIIQAAFRNWLSQGNRRKLLLGDGSAFDGSEEEMMAKSSVIITDASQPVTEEKDELLEDEDDYDDAEGEEYYDSEMEDMMKAENIPPPDSEAPPPEGGDAEGPPE